MNPRPYINAMTAVFCEGFNFTVTPAVGAPGINGIVPANTSFNWSAPSVSGNMTGGAGATVVGGITGNLVNPTSTQQTAVYIVTPTAPQGNCVGATFTLTVTINPNAAINTMSTTICSGLTFRVTPTDSIDGQVPTGASGWHLLLPVFRVRLLNRLPELPIYSVHLPIKLILHGRSPT